MAIASINPWSTVRKIFYTSKAPTFESIQRKIQELSTLEWNVSDVGKFGKVQPVLQEGVTPERVQQILNDIATLLNDPKSDLRQYEINNLKEYERGLKSTLVNLRQQKK
jgi:hypothetical protein